MWTKLLDETIEIIEANGYTTDDVWFITDGVLHCQWDEFAEQVGDYIYDSGYGTNIINQNLSVVMKDKTWFSRSEYDGSEWWTYNKRPPHPRRPGLLQIEEKRRY